MNLVSHIIGVGPTVTFTPGPTTPSPFNIPHTGLTDGVGPATASANMAEIYNRILLQIAATISVSGLTVDNNNWTQMATAVVSIAENAATEAREAAWPIGSVYINARNSANPSTILGFGTWVEYGVGRFIVGQQSTSFPTLGGTGGTTTGTTASAGGGTTSDATVSMKTAGFTADGGATPPGTVPLGRMVIGSGVGEVGESLESLTWGSGGDVPLAPHSHATNNHTHVVEMTPPHIIAKMWERTA